MRRQLLQSLQNRISVRRVELAALAVRRHVECRTRKRVEWLVRIDERGRHPQALQREKPLLPGSSRPERPDEWRIEGAHIEQRFIEVEQEYRGRLMGLISPLAFVWSPQHRQRRAIGAPRPLRVLNRPKLRC